MNQLCCISFDSYIKPQLITFSEVSISVVYLLTPTSNHNWERFTNLVGIVVYLLTPTSNHNHITNNPVWVLLYIFWLLHQTTTFLKRQYLHYCCISFDSYIKPHLCVWTSDLVKVVYLLTPTSNHNIYPISLKENRLYIFWLLHQTTTVLWMLHQCWGCISFDSYIKPQPYGSQSRCFCSCISFDSYIKPQLGLDLKGFFMVVYLLTPTSNHNLDILSTRPIMVVYLLTPTSNHNAYDL